MVDFHIHSYYSDGLDSLDKLVSKTKDFEFFSVIDHDNIVPSRKITENNFVTGAEVSISGKNFKLPSEFHFLIYNFNPLDEKINSLFEEFNYYNNLLFTEILVKIIESNNFKIDINALKKYIDEKVTLSKIQIIKILLEHGYGKNLYDTYFQYVKPFLNISKHYIKFKDLVSTLKNNGGYILLVHPFAYNLNESGLANLINDLPRYDVDGIEIAADNQVETLRYIHKYNFIYSLGSDYHGEVLQKCNSLGIDDSRFSQDKSYIKNKILEMRL